MSIGSPSAYLLWAILSTIFEVFLILHLWSYDRFKCIKWDSGRQPGAFKRVMTYSYLATLPLLMVFAVSLTIIKFEEGYVVVENKIIPRPMAYWSEPHQAWALPLFFVLSVAWALEIMTHLEELTFWLFLLNQGPSKREWFRSWEFRVWYMGSLVAAVGLPLTTLMTRHHLEQCIAWIFLLGSSAGGITTIAFIYVMAKFPGFIRHVKAEGAIPDIVVRLVTFYQFHLIRMAFRFLFSFPLLVIGIDGVRGPHNIVLDKFWPDFLLMLGGIGCTVSSVITLLIFFPRSITNESGYNARTPSGHSAKEPPQIQDQEGSPSSLPEYNQHPDPNSPISPHSPYGHAHMSSFRFPSHVQPHNQHDQGEATPEYESDPEQLAKTPGSPTSIAKERRHSQEIDQLSRLSGNWGESANSPYPFQRRKVHEVQLEASSSTVLHPYVMNFTSPIDLSDQPLKPRQGVPNPPPATAV